MATTMGGRAAEFLLSEAPGTLSRQDLTLLEGQNLTAGTVLGIVTASGKAVAYDDDGVDDGRRDAAGILLYDTDATDGDTQCVAIVRLAEVVGAKLTGLDSAGQTDLGGSYIIVRS